MESLSNFPALKEALSQLVVETDVDNGTNGMEFLAYWYAKDFVRDEKRDDLNKQIARAVLTGTVEQVEELQAKLSLLPRPQIMMEWKLMEPIAKLRGTKVGTLKRNGEVRRFKLEMSNVTSIFISEKAAQLGLIEYERTDIVAQDANGRDSIVVRMVLKKGLIDVAAPIYFGDKEVRGKRAYVQAVSNKALQVVGSMLFQEKKEENRLLGYDEIL